MISEYEIFPVPMRLGETPVHIPNTMVKTLAADDTILETVWESRRVPDLLKKFTNDLKSKNFLVSTDW